MAFTHGKNVDVFVNEFDLTSYFTSMDFAREVDTPESTTFGDDDREYIAGLRGGNVSLSGFFDDTATTGSDEVLNATLGVTTARVVSIGPDGTAIGEVVYMFNTHSTSYSVSGSVDGIVELSADLIATGQMDRGHSLHPLTARSSSGDTNSTDVQGSQTTNGGIGHLHVTSVSSGTTLDVDVEDAAVATFATLMSFTQVTTAATSERKTVTGTVEANLSVAWVLVGTSYTFSVAFARR